MRLMTRMALPFAMLAASSAGAATTDFPALEAAGVRIGEVRVVTRDVFDTSQPGEDYGLFRLANRMHVRTREQVVRERLLFAAGEALSAQRVAETERLLRGERNFYDVEIVAVPVAEHLVDLEVRTRDTWTLALGASAGREGGRNSSSLGLKDYNVMGTGAMLAYAHNQDSERSGNQLEFAYDRAFDGWTTLRAGYASNSDGRRQEAAVVRPFRSLDARWAAGASWLDDDRVESLYQAGEVSSKYRYRERGGEVFAGWSAGLRDGWTRRWSAGVSWRQDAYAAEPGEPTPPVISADARRAGPFVRYELIEDDYSRRDNRNQMGRPEFFPMGLAFTAQLGRALTGWDSDRAAWLYSAKVSDGFILAPGHELLASAHLRGEQVDGRSERQVLGAEARYYWAWRPRLLFFAGAQLERATRPDLAGLLGLGGDSGLRGYPLHFQTGERRAVFTVEARTFTDLFIFRLFRVGAAAYFDVGSAWGGPYSASPHADWHRDVGIGLRIFSVRSAFGNVLHIDLAKPLDRDGGIKGLQFLVKSRASF